MLVCYAQRSSLTCYYDYRQEGRRMNDERCRVWLGIHLRNGGDLKITWRARFVFCRLQTPIVKSCLLSVLLDHNVAPHSRVFLFMSLLTGMCQYLQLFLALAPSGCVSSCACTSSCRRFNTPQLQPWLICSSSHTLPSVDAFSPARVAPHA